MLLHELLIHLLYFDLNLDCLVRIEQHITLLDSIENKIHEAYFPGQLRLAMVTHHHISALQMVINQAGWRKPAILVFKRSGFVLRLKDDDSDTF